MSQKDDPADKTTDKTSLPRSEEEHRSQPPANLNEIRFLMGIISGVAWVNLMVAVLSALFFCITRDLSLLATGSLSLLTFWLLRSRVRDAMQDGGWVEVCITAIGGIYFPSYVLWLSVINIYAAMMTVAAHF